MENQIDPRLVRLEDWPLRLDAALASARGRAFAWGEFDCALFACDVVDAITGGRLAARFRGRYRTPAGARRALARAGGIEGLAAKVGAEVLPLTAQRGDPVELPVPEGSTIEGVGFTLGIALGAQVIAVSERGLALVPLRKATRAWHIEAVA